MQQANFKIDKTAWIDFQMKCKMEGTNATSKLREFVHAYIQNS